MDQVKLETKQRTFEKIVLKFSVKKSVRMNAEVVQIAPGLASGFPAWSTLHPVGSLPLVLPALLLTTP